MGGWFASRSCSALLVSIRAGQIKLSFVFIHIRYEQLISHQSELHSVLKSCVSSGKLSHARACSSSYKYPKAKPPKWHPPLAQPHPQPNTLIWQSQQLQQSRKLQETSQQNKLGCDECLQSSGDPNSCHSTAAYQMSRGSSYRAEPRLCPSLSQAGAMHIALLLPPPQQRELPSDRIILLTWVLPAGTWFPQRAPRSNGMHAGFVFVCCKNIAHCNSEICTCTHQGFPVLSSLIVSPLRRDGRLKVTLKFLLCSYWGPKEASTHRNLFGAKLHQNSLHTSCSCPYKYFHAFRKTFLIKGSS